jgi:hypothetical protein
MMQFERLSVLSAAALGKQRTLINARASSKHRHRLNNQCVL